MNPQKTIHQADIREDDLIQLHVRPRSEEKVIFSKQILLKEYRSMIDLKEESNGLIDFRVSNDYRKYTISVKGIKTIVDTTRENIVESDHYVFTIDLPSKYPLQPPVIRFNRTIFHPNWSSDGKVNYEMLWGSEDKKLSRILIYIINLMFFNIVNTHSPSNQEAIEYYKRNKENIKNMSKVHLFLFSKGDGLEFFE
jgi:ubiquitin-protein ligase